MTSGDSTSDSRGTTGCSLRVSVIMPAPVPSFARRDVRMPEALDLGRIVFERHRIDLLEQRTDVILDGLVVGRTGDELMALRHHPHFAFLDHDLAPLEHVAR